MVSAKLQEFCLDLIVSAIMCPPFGTLLLAVIVSWYFVHETAMREKEKRKT